MIPKKAMLTFLTTLVVLSFHCIEGNAQQVLSTDYFEARISEARQQGDSTDLATALLAQARFEKERNHIKPSIQAYLESISILEKKSHRALYHRALTELAEIYLDQHFLSEAQEYLQRSAAYFSQITDTVGLLNAHFLLARVFLEKDLLDKAESQTKAFNSLIADPNDSLQLIRKAILEGYMLEKKFRPTEAISAFHQAYLLSKAFREPTMYTLSTMELGRLHLNIGEAEKAIVALSRAEAFNLLSENHEQLKEIFSNLARAYQMEGNFQAAYEYLGKYSRLNDSLLNERRQEIINKLNIRYEAQQKQMEIISLANEKRLADLKARNDNISLYSMLIGFIGVLVAAYFTILYYQQRLSANQIIADQKEKINQSHINELRNSLELESMRSMIQGQEMERDRIAKDLHDSLGGLLSSIKLKYDALKYEKSNGHRPNMADPIHTMLDNAIHEVRAIASNLTPGSLQKLGLVKAVEDLISKVSGEHYPSVDFQYYGMDLPLDEFTSLHCYRIIQELLVNSVKHASADEILVQMTRQEDHLSILVEDDGDGYDAGSITKGMGTDNILSRVSMLKGDIHIETAPGKGTSTFIQIPLQRAPVRENT